MPSVLINSVTYPVYADVDDADIYFGGSVSFSDWDALTDDEKARGLVSSTRLIDRQKWLGEKTDPLQELAFPRSGLTDCDGTAIDEDTIPDAVIDASMLLALDLATGSTVTTSATTEDLTKRLKAGSVEIEKFRADQTTVTRFPLPIMELLGCFMSGSITVAGSLDYGTDGCGFDGDYSFNQGF
jgi:hypothetical protein